MIADALVREDHRPAALPAPARRTTVRPIGLRLLSKAGLACAVVTLAVTAGAAVFEWRAATNDIRAGFFRIEADYAPRLADALWRRDRRETDALLAAITAAPDVAGIGVVDDETGLMVAARGFVIDPQGRPVQAGAGGDMTHAAIPFAGPWIVRHEFPLALRTGRRNTTLFDATLYADGGVLLARIGWRLAVVAGALGIQGLALWMLSVHLARRMLSLPLARLTAHVDRVNLDRVSLDHGGRAPRPQDGLADELTVLEDAVAEMARRVRFEFRSLVEGSVQGMLVLQDGRVRFANQAAAHLLGCARPEDLVLLPSLFPLLPEARQAGGERLARRLQSRPAAKARLTLPVARPDGHRTWLQIQVQQVAWRGGPALLASLADVTATRRIAIRLRASEQRFRRMFAGHAAIMLLVDPVTHRLVDANRAALAFYGFTRDELVGRPLSELDVVDEPDPDTHLGLAPGGGTSGERRHRLKSGAVRDIEISATAIGVGSGERVYFTIVHDITVRKAMEEELWRKATYDALTGAVARGHFLDRAATEVRRARRQGRPLSLLAFDLDHFKAVNDGYGHAAGDEVLRQVVRAATAQLRDSDVLGRIGGEEFVVLLPGAGMDGAIALARRLQETIASLSIATDGASIGVTVSIGVASGGGSIDDIMERADQALYRAKRAGRNRVEIDGAILPAAGRHGG
jgi:diguanylate cyclase (GGDEF)-like protein/PAS domain S-box-containing protein